MSGRVRGRWRAARTTEADRVAESLCDLRTAADGVADTTGRALGALGAGLAGDQPPVLVENAAVRFDLADCDV